MLLEPQQGDGWTNAIFSTIVELVTASLKMSREKKTLIVDLLQRVVVIRFVILLVCFR